MLNKIIQDLTAAMRDKDKERLLVLRSLKAALMNKKIELTRELTTEETIEVISKAVKSREQSIELYEKGGRIDLAAIEKKEVEIIRNYLPAPLTPEELENLVKDAIKETGASSMKDMGIVMKHLAPIKNRTDGKTLSSVIKSQLS